MSTGPSAGLAGLADLTAELVDRWTALQVEWWRGLLLGIQGGPAAADAWRDAAHRVVDAQAQLLNHWLETHVVAASPQHVAAADAFLRHWTDAQRQMWVNSLAASTGGGSPADAQAGTRMVDELEAAAERLVTAQAEWAAAFAGRRRATR
jgi:hypothetical protein